MQQRSQAPQNRSNLTFMFIGIGILACLVLAALQMMRRVQTDPIEPTAPVIIQQASATPTESETPIPTDAPTLTNTPTEPPTATATFAPSNTPTDAPTPTETAKPPSTNTPRPTTTPGETVTTTATITTTAGTETPTPLTANESATPDETNSFIVRGTPSPNPEGTDSFMSEVPEPNGIVKSLSTDTVNLRKGPSTATTILVRVENGALIYVHALSQDGQWYEVTTLLGDHGYIKKEYVVLREEQAAICGNLICEDDEDAEVCPADCIAIPTPTGGPTDDGFAVG